MKKHRELIGFLRLSQKLSRIMRLTCIFILAIAINSQALNLSLPSNLEIRKSNLVDALKVIENQSNYYFYYNSNELSGIKVSGGQYSNKQIDYIMDDLLKETDLSYKVIDRYVVIRKKGFEGEIDTPKEITGIVTDENGEPLTGVNVFDKTNPTKGVVTNIDGAYKIVVASDKTVLTFSFIGYSTQKISVTGTNQINVKLLPDMADLEEVVVTALGIKREKKALGYAVQEIKSEQLSSVKSTSVASALAGKLSGVQINQSGTGMTGSTRIVIRGASSLADNNTPLWVVDGIPIDDSQNYKGAGQWGGRDGAGAASQLDMENIETISVLKGASASALYGSRAANGVILVTTKRGKKGELKVNINSNASIDAITDYYEMQDMYGQGKNGVYNPDVKVSWGPKMTGQTIDNWRTGRDAYAMLPQDQIGNFYRNGTSFTNNVNISGGSDLATFRLSISDKRVKGITPENDLNRQSIDLTSVLKKNDKFDISAKFNVIREEVNNRPINGGDGTMSQFLGMPRNIRLQDLQPAIDNNGQQVLYGGATSSDRNPYFQVKYKDNVLDTRYRLISVINSNLKLAPYLTLSGKVGVDYYRDQQENQQWKDFVDSSSGAYTLREGHFREYNADVLLKFNKTFGDFHLGLNAGSSIMSRTVDHLQSKVSGLYVDGLRSVVNGSTIVSENGITEKEIQSVFGFGSVSYKNFAFLDFTARNDWSSTLPADNNSYFYPSVSGSFLISEFLNSTGKTIPAWLTYAKLRGSIAQVGNDTFAYRTKNTFLILTNGTNGVSYGERPTQYPFSNIKPEIQTSKEIGIDLKFFNGRLGIDYTMYKTSTKNQIMPVAMTATSGYTSRLINAGEIDNTGIELAITGNLIKTNDFNWDITLNWGTNKNEIIELSKEYGVKKHQITDNYLLQVWAYEGGEFGEIHGKTYRRDQISGKILIDDKTGLPLYKNSKSKIGSINPDWTGSIYNSFSYKNLSLSILVDMKMGGDIVSFDDANAVANGTSILTANRPSEGLLIDGITVKRDDSGNIMKDQDGNFLGTGTPNTKRVSAEQYWSHVGTGKGCTEQFIYDASYIKLREIALNYTLPKSLMDKTPIESARIGITARNLFYLYRDNENLNPEGTIGRNARQQAYTYSALPTTATFGFNLSLTF